MKNEDRKTSALGSKLYEFLIVWKKLHQAVVLLATNNVKCTASFILQLYHTMLEKVIDERRHREDTSRTIKRKLQFISCKTFCHIIMYTVMLKKQMEKNIVKS